MQRQLADSSAISRLKIDDFRMKLLGVTAQTAAHGRGERLGSRGPAGLAIGYRAMGCGPRPWSLGAGVGPLVVCGLAATTLSVAAALMGPAFSAKAHAFASKVCALYQQAVPVSLASGQEWVRLAGAFCLWDALNPPLLAKLVAIAVGLLTLPLARGATVWLALRRPGSPGVTWPRLRRAVAARGPLLLACGFGYMLLVVCGTAALGLQRRTDRVAGGAELAAAGDLLPALVPSRDMPDALITHAIRLLIPEATLGDLVSGPVVDPPAGYQNVCWTFKLNNVSRGTMGNSQAPLLDYCVEAEEATALTTLMGLALLGLAELLSPFWLALAMRPGIARRRGRSLHVLKGFGVLISGPGLAHVGLMRLVLLTTTVLFIALPASATQAIWATHSLPAPWVASVVEPLTTASGALVGSLLSLIGLVYAARMYRALYPSPSA